MGLALLGRSLAALGCECDDQRVVLPPPALTDSRVFEAPTNTHVWILEHIGQGGKRSHYNVRAQHSLATLGTPRHWPSAGRRREDCRLRTDYWVTEIDLPELQPRSAYEVVALTESGAEVISSFRTSAGRDASPPVIEGGLGCSATDGYAPAEAICELHLPQLSVTINARDDTTPGELLLYRAGTASHRASDQRSDSRAPVLQARSGVVEWSAGNLCRGRTLRFPEPFERTSLEVEAMDLAGNVSPVKDCPVVGPQTHESRALLERALGCPPCSLPVRTAPPPRNDRPVLGSRLTWALLASTILLAVTTSALGVWLWRMRRTTSAPRGQNGH